MSVRAIIEKRLEVVNDAIFQDLCNSVISQKHHLELHSPGTVVGKDKTKAGRPDAFFPLANGQYIISEYTTKDDGRKGEFFDKLMSDLQGCLDFISLGIPAEKINQIILCCNSEITLSQHNALRTHADVYGIPLTIYGIQKLAEYLAFDGRAIAKEYLQVPITEGSLLTRNRFVDLYQKGHLSTSLETEWVGRSGQAEALVSEVTKHDMVIVKGGPGVGKTRLALEAIDLFLNGRPDYQAYYLLRQLDSILEDLTINIQNGANYILFLDDGNKQPGNLLQSIARQAEEKSCRIKIVTTVRDYARADVIKCVGDMKKVEFTLGRMDNDSLARLIRQVYPEIIQQTIIDHILQISDGNPRLALMAASTVRDHNNLNILVDAGHIYAAYFDPIIDLNPIFKQTSALKAMGLIAFFDTLDLEDAGDLSILARFGCDRDEFLEIIRELEVLEFVEIYDYTVVRVAEQTMATYFFYKVFIKEKLLSFSEIVTDYFASRHWQIRDAIVPANLIFGDDKVINRIKDNLINYYQGLSRDSNSRIQFLHVFGRYFSNEVFSYIMEDISQMNDVEGLAFGMDAIAKNVGYFDHHPILKLLEVQWEAVDRRTVEAAIDLAFRLLRKQPSLYESLIKKLQKSFAVSRYEPLTHARQEILFEWMHARRLDEAVIRPAFYAVFGRLLLGYHFDQECYRREEGKIILDDSVAQPRAKFWEILIEKYAEDRQFSFRLLLQYIDDSEYYSGVLLKFDLPYFKRLIATRLLPMDFGSCYFVNLYATILREKKVLDQELRTICSPFDTNLWRLFCLYANDPFLRARDRGDFTDYEKREAARANRIRQSVIDYTANFYRKIHRSLNLMSNFEYSSRYNFAWANDIVLAEIAKRNADEGFKALQYYAKKENWFGAFPSQALRNFFEEGREWAEKAWKVIDKSHFLYKFKWLEHFFFLMPPEFIDERCARRLLKTFRDTPSGFCFYENSLDKFELIEPTIYQQVLKILLHKRATDEKFVFQLGYQFFKTVAVKKITLETCKAAYFQRERMPGHFDNDSSEFFVLFEHDQNFLMEYSHFVTVECPMRFMSDYRPLGRIWDIQNAENLVSDVFRNLLALSETRCCKEMVVSLFFGIKETNVNRALAFLEGIIQEYKESDVMIDWIFEIARSYFATHYMRLIVCYLHQNPDLERFKRKSLLSSSFFTSTNEIWEEVRAHELQKIHSQISGNLDRITYMGHLNFINEWLRGEQKRAKYTRRMRFRKLEF